MRACGNLLASGSGPAVFAFVLAVGSAHAQSLEGTGFPSPYDRTQASAVSGDGTVVVGQAFTSNLFGPMAAFRWSATGGMADLGTLGGYNQPFAAGVNYDGTVVVGTLGGLFVNSQAFRWLDGPGMTGLGYLPGDSWSSATGVSADGKVIVGNSGTSSSDGQAFRWVDDGSSTGHMEGLGLAGGTRTQANAVSADGKVVVGNLYYSTEEYQTFRWSESEGMHSLFPVGFPFGMRASATAVNADGSVVVGSIYQDSTASAYRWVYGELYTVLGQLGTGDFSEALAVSADGSVVVGRAGDGTSFEAFYWAEGEPEGMVSVASLLQEAGVEMTGWVLETATGISADGTVIVGSGSSPDSSLEAWIARLGPTPGVTTREAALNSLLTLGQVPNLASNFVLNLLGTNSEYARQHSVDVSAPPVQPLAYGEESDSGVAAMASPRPLRVFGYGLGGAAFDPNGASGAALIGASVAVTDHLVVGGSVGYGAVRSDMDMGGEVTIRGPSATMFIASTPETGLQFLAAGSVAGFDADIRRGYMNGAGEASSSGETDGAGYGGLVRAGYAFALDDRNRLEPFAQYEAVHSRLDAYAEKGGPFPAEISKMSQTDQIGRLGAELRHRFRPDAWIWGSAAWAHRFDDSGVDLAIQFIDLFGVSGSAPVGASDWMEAAVGISLPVGHDVRLTGSVTAGLFGEGSDTLLGRVGVSSAF